MQFVQLYTKACNCLSFEYSLILLIMTRQSRNWGEDENHWSKDSYDPRCNDMEREAQTFSLQQLGKEMKESGCPSQLLTSNDDDDDDDKLNEKGVMLCCVK